MRVSLFLPSLDGGGAERVMVTLANSFATRGAVVDLILARAEGPYLEEVSDRVRILDLKSTRILKSIPALAHYLRTERPRALLSTLRHANIAASIAHNLARSSARLVLREANHVNMTDFDGLVGTAQSLLYRWSHNKADAIIGVSKGVSSSVGKVIGSNRNITTIYNPIDIDKIITLSHQPTNCENIEPEDKIVLAVGRLSGQKDYPTLLRAFAQLQAQVSAKLIILGEGEQRPTLENLVESLSLSKNVIMPGFVENPFALMRRANVFVLSSRWEGLPNALIQAMACGASIVSTDCPSGPDEILEHGKWGHLVPVGDAPALAKATLKALSLPAPQGLLERAKDFGLDKSVAEYEKILRI